MSESSSRLASMPEPTYLSSHIFDLAEESGVSLRSGDAYAISPDTFRRFRDTYLQWSRGRDEALLRYLGSTPGTFRCLLKYSDRTFTTAYQVLWYLDEVVVAEPCRGPLICKVNPLGELNVLGLPGR